MYFYLPSEIHTNTVKYVSCIVKIFSFIYTWTSIYLFKYKHENTQTHARTHIHNIHMMDDIRNVIAKNNDPLNFTTYYVQCYKY